METKRTKSLTDRNSLASRVKDASLLALILCGFGILPANTQVMPGMRAPNDLVDAAVMAVTGACHLASARRPVPGINAPADGLAGEGVNEHRSAPSWVEKASQARGRSRFATLASPDGLIWIRFDESTARCSVIVRPSDVGKFRSAFGDSLAKGGTAGLKRESASDGSEMFLTEAPTFSWTTRVSVPAKLPDVVLIETRFAQK
jgi:hypothetical protein